MSVFGPWAEKLLTCVSAGATAAVALFWYLMMVFAVHTASSAVSGLPSDHLAFGFRWNVQVSPSELCDQEVAQSPSSLVPGPYWTSCG